MLEKMSHIFRGYATGSTSKTALVIWGVFALVALRFFGTFIMR